MKDPGPFCKRCYHKHISPGRAGRPKAKGKSSPGLGVDTGFDLSDVIDAHDWFGDEVCAIYEDLHSAEYSERFRDVEEHEFPFDTGDDEAPRDEDEIPFDGEDDEIPF